MWYEIARCITLAILWGCIVANLWCVAMGRRYNKILKMQIKIAKDCIKSCDRLIKDLEQKDEVADAGND